MSMDDVESNLRRLEEMAAFFNARAETYDSHMLDDIGLDEFYEAIAACFTAPINRLLDLGCGTGLELERLFVRNPQMEVIGIDVAEEMLALLAAKYPGKKLRLICGSYFDVAFDGCYDHVLSTYSLHHFSEERKLWLYQKIIAAMQPGGLFINGDYSVATEERQQVLLRKNDELRRKQGVPEGEFYHFDIPFTAATEMKLLRSTGFTTVEVVRQWENTTIIAARK